jgi:hypothetical protein
MELKIRLTKIRMLWTHFMRQKGMGLKCKHFIVFRFYYRTEAYICAKCAYYVIN